MAPRLKKAAVAVPQTRQDFETLAAQLGEIRRRTERRASLAADAIAAVKLTLKTEGDGDAKEAAALWVALSAYIEAHRGELLPPDRKSVAIAAGTIGFRLSNPRVDIDDDELLIAHCESLGLDRFLRVETKISKEAILADRAAAAALPGVEIVQKDEVFFKPLEADAEFTKTLKREAA